MIQKSYSNKGCYDMSVVTILLLDLCCSCYQFAQLGWY
jgi:hypothetical protein